MEVLTILAVAFVCIASFLVGAKVGQAVSKGEKIEPPTVNPLKVYREHEAKKVAQAEQDKVAVIMSNIESYNGTSDGQKDVPR